MRKVSIVGAGFVGSTIAYALTLQNLANDIVLVDINNDKSRAEALDIGHSGTFISDIEVKYGEYKDTKGSDIVIITAGAQIKQGESRLDVVNKSLSIYKAMIPEIVKYSEDSILLVVGNPVDILTYYTYKISGFDKSRVIGSGTVLDSARFKYSIGESFNLNTKNIDAMVIGEHGDSQVPLWSYSRIYGVNILKYANTHNIELDAKFKNHIAKETRKGGIEIVEGKGYTNFGVATAIARIVRAIFHDENSVLPVGALYQGEYGIEDVYMAAPTIVNRHGIKEILTVKISEEEKESLKKSAELLNSVLKEEVRIK